MAFLLLYSPFLILLPVLLLALVLFVVVPGGFIIVLGFAYFLSAAFVGRVLRLATRRSGRATGARPPKVRAGAARSRLGSGDVTEGVSFPGGPPSQ